MSRLSLIRGLEKIGLSTTQGPLGRLRRLEKWLAFNRPRLSVHTARELLAFQVDSWSAMTPRRVDAPLVFVSQPQRSGGSLFMQLLDGHPSLWVYPNELDHLKGLGAGAWTRWMAGRPAAADVVDNWLWIMRLGYSKMSGNMSELRREARYVEPFFFSWKAFRAAYEGAGKGPGEARVVLADYFTAFFHAWLNDANRGGPAGDEGADKRFVCAFAPGAVRSPDSDLDAYFAAHPEGRVISILRDPWSWYASASRHSSKYGGLDEAVAYWREQNMAHVEAARARPGQVLLLAFEDVLGRPEPTMRRVADWLGIPYDPILTRPTFNRQPVWSNSSFEVKRGVIDDAPLKRAAMEEDNRARIEALVGDDYRAMRALADGANGANGAAPLPSEG